jgi:hypothetical protein
MQQKQFAKWLLVASALATLIIPIVTDAVFLADAHMNNPAWLPHAKLHCAMSFFAAASLGGAALAILAVRSTSDRFSIGLAAFLSSAFWIGLIAAGFLPGTSYEFLNDPVFGKIHAPEWGGITIYPNVVTGLMVILISVIGYGLTNPVKSSERTS